MITIIGIPSAFLLHGYVGFIFGSVKANPWWSTPLMPVVFIFSAMVSGIAAVMLLYMLLTWFRKQTIDMRCVDTVARYLFYTFIIDFSLEMLDLIHRIYESDESHSAASISWSIPSCTCRISWSRYCSARLLPLPFSP
jgi:formate-dependent nitrite reductase membrane component NrfD